MRDCCCHADTEMATVIVRKHVKISTISGKGVKQKCKMIACLLIDCKLVAYFILYRSTVRLHRFSRRLVISVVPH